MPARKRARSPSEQTTASASISTRGFNFSSNAASIKSTPVTSDNEDHLGSGRRKRITRSSTAANSAASSASKKPTAKRAQEVDSDDLDDSASPPPATPAPSRRSSRRPYTDIVTPAKKGKGKAPVANKGKAKAPPKSETPSEDDIDVDEDEDKEPPEHLSETPSGSEFEASEVESDFEEEEEEDVPASRRRSFRNSLVDDALSSDALDEIGDPDADEDADEVMLDAAIQDSLRSSRNAASGSSAHAGPSTSAAGSSRAARHAAAAEKRLKLLNEARDGSPELSDMSDASSDARLAKKGKNKNKAPVKSTSSVPSLPSNVQTLETRKYLAALERRRKATEAKILSIPTRAKEKALRRKLGRKLTHSEKTHVALLHHHPELEDVWGDLEASIPLPVVQRGVQPPGLKLALLPFQLESLHWMRKQEGGIWHGGMLADEMGMGKTIQTLALLVSDQRKPNLIVAPTVAVMQWRNEIAAHTTGFQVAVWHGHSREKDPKVLNKFDVVLTTYSVLESAFRRQQSGAQKKGKIVKEVSPLHSVHWARIILDEAHNIKERSTNTAKAAFELKSDFKWCLSGTPLQNRVGELYSLVRFLGGDPFSFYFCKRCECKSLHWKFSDKKTCDDCGHSPSLHTCFWNNEILGPIQKNGMIGEGKTAFKKLKILLDRMMLRRTKIERADDLGLPPRTVIVRRDYFSEEEKELYLSLFSDAKRQFSTYVDAGTLLNNYSNIFSLITRMRQMACHPDLVLKSKRNQAFSGDIVEATVCRICNDIAEDAIESKCHHIFDRACISQYLDASIELSPACPVCHVPLSIDLEAPAIDDGEDGAKKARQGILGRVDLDGWRSSSKIEALVEELTNLRRTDSTVKSIVFSQFVNFLDLIAFRLQRAGFTICRLEGTMSPQARDATIKHFMNNVGVTVFLVSLKAGGVALNLTEASRVYLMDSWWNPAVEFQAMDRIHRLGQHRPVEAIKLVIEDSIESRIIQLQEKKSAMVDATLSADDQAMGRLTPEDLGFLCRL